MLSRRPSSGASLGAFEAVKPASSDATLSPSDRLCMLLRHAQSLASLTLEERPATMVWLVRSAVFRAIYDFKDLLPDAVAQLYRCTGIGRDLPSPAAGSRASSRPPSPPWWSWSASSCPAPRCRKRRRWPSSR